MNELGLDPKWRWDELIKLTKKRFDLEFDVSFTDIFYNNYIIPAYTGENRHYQTLNHIELMLSRTGDWNLSHKDKVKLRWAIWFHDIVYDATKTDNEEKSANMLVDFAWALGFEEEDIEEMKWLVLVTTHKGNPQTRLEDIICDLDLRELAGEMQPENTPLIRKEFGHLTDEEFNKGRVQFLDFMLAKEFIYHTENYKFAFEKNARENLQRELNNLKIS